MLIFKAHLAERSGFKQGGFKDAKPERSFALEIWCHVCFKDLLLKRTSAKSLEAYDQASPTHTSQLLFSTQASCTRMDDFTVWIQRSPSQKLTISDTKAQNSQKALYKRGFGP